MAKFLANITPPGQPDEPGGDLFGVISIDDLKAHLRIVTDDSENDYLAGLIRAATAQIDGATGWLGRALLTQQWAWTCDSFPCGRDSGFTLPLPPLQSIDSITYIDAAGIVQTVDEDDYIIVESTPARVIPADGKSWPHALTTEAGITITFTCGYGKPEDVPEPIKQWIKIVAGNYYANRESIIVGTISSELSFIDTMLNNFRVI